MGKPNIETYAPQLLLELIAGRPDKQKLEWLAKDFRHDFGWAESAGSWNHWQMLAACELWREAREGIIDLWQMYLEAQTGNPKASAVPKNHPTLGFFNGSEQFSNTYEGWRWGAVLAVRLWALRNPKHRLSPELSRLTARYTEVQTALLALGAAPGPTRIGTVLSAGPNQSVEVRPHTHRTGRQTWWRGPSLPMAGARSTPAHLGTDERMPIYAHYRGIDFPPYKRDRFEWPQEVLGSLADPEIFNAETSWADLDRALSGVRLLVPHHFLRWSVEGVRLNYMERLKNPNTTSILFHVYRERDRSATYGFPFPGRIRSGIGPATCAFDEGGNTIRAASRFGEVAAMVPQRRPDSYVTIGPEGLRRIA